VCAAYKWLLSCYGTGFFSGSRGEHLDRLRAYAFLLDRPEHGQFFGVEFCRPQNRAATPKRWDAAEWATYYNFNLSAMAESVDFVLRAGPEVVTEHNRHLIEFMFSRLPEDRCVSRKSAGSG